jgi:hypothetical protein
VAAAVCKKRRQQLQQQTAQSRGSSSGVLPKGFRAVVQQLQECPLMCDAVPLVKLVPSSSSAVPGTCMAAVGLQQCAGH